MQQLMHGHTECVAGEIAMKKALKLIFFSVLFALLMACFAWFVLWFFSSSSMACLECNCNYSLFSETFRCKQPILALIGVAMSVLLLGTTVYYFRKMRNSEVSGG
jgi:hypothetical protein